MSLYFGLIMFLCIVPTLFICFYQIYPKKWREKKLVFGVKNREEFQQGETGQAVDEIYDKYRGQARLVVIIGSVISVLLLLLHGIALQTTIWTSFVFLAILAINMPFFLGNREMKDLKRRLGLKEEAGISYVDLTNAGSVRALKSVQVILPNVAGIALALVTLLVDLKVIPVKVPGAGNFLGTAMVGTFVAIGVMITAFAILMDRMRNEVISGDSTVNANYNRAKKKNMADFFVLFLWVNVALTAGTLGAFVLWSSDGTLMLMLLLYLLFLMGGTAAFVWRERRIEACYQKEISVFADDDDNWLGGMLYYNPKDNRLNVEKRVGVGGTINLAHPMGKLFGGMAVLAILATIASVVWICMVEATPISLRVQDGKVICHQLRDEYVIELKDMESVEYGESLKDLQLIRVSGVGMESLLKGNFTVNGQNGCKVFLATEAGNYVKIVAAGKTYYVSGATAEETREAYRAIEGLRGR